MRCKQAWKSFNSVISITVGVVVTSFLVLGAIIKMRSSYGMRMRKVNVDTDDRSDEMLTLSPLQGLPITNI